MPSNNLSPNATPFIPNPAYSSIHYYFDQYDFLKTLESKVTSDSALLFKIKSAFYNLKTQLDISLNNTGSLNTPVPTFPIPSSPSLTPRQLKRQLRAANFRARKVTDSVEPTISRKPLHQKLPPLPQRKCSFKHLDIIDDGTIKLPDPPIHLTSKPVSIPVSVPIQSSSLDNEISPSLSILSSSSMRVSPLSTTPSTDIFIPSKTAIQPCSLPSELSPPQVTQPSTSRKPLCITSLSKFSPLKYEDDSDSDSDISSDSDTDFFNNLFEVSFRF